MPNIALQLKVTHTFDIQLFSQVSPFSTFQRRSLQDEKHLDQNLGIFLILKNFSRILEKFHFSISISRHFHFTFHSRSQGIFISLFILEMSERKTKFTFQFSKRVKAFQISLFFSRKKSEIVHVTSYFVMTNSHF